MRINAWAFSREDLATEFLDALSQLKYRFRRRIYVAAIIGCSGALSRLLVDLMIVDYLFLTKEAACIQATTHVKTSLHKES
jgi:hypothetical protein